MGINVIDPIEKSWKRMMRICFEPFDLSKWLGLGFCSWLALLGSGGGNTNIISNFGNVGGVDSYDLDQGGQWDSTQPDLFGGPMGDFPLNLEFLNSGLFLGIAIATTVVSLLLMVVMLWVKSRGTFMFMDGVVHDRGDVVAPWNEFKKEGTSLFKVQIALMAVIFGVLLLFTGVMAAIGFSMQDVGPGIFIVMTLGMMFVMLLAIIPMWIFLFVLNNFVTPVMYLQRISFKEAWGVVKPEMLSGNLGPIAAFFGIQILFGIGAGIVATVVTIFTCCLAALPFVGSVLLLPLAVFFQSYTLYFVEEFGPQFAIFQDEDM